MELYGFMFMPGITARRPIESHFVPKMQFISVAALLIIDRITAICLLFIDFTQYRCSVVEFVCSGRSHASPQFSWQCFGIANEQCFYVELKIQQWALVSRHCSWLCILLATANIRISRLNFFDILWKRLYNCLFSALFSQAVLEMTRSWSSYSVKIHQYPHICSLRWL